VRGFFQGGTLRFAGVSAYYLGAPAASSFSIGCQQISNNAWNASTSTWSTAPTFNPAAAIHVVNLSYDPSSSSPCWVSWPMCDEVMHAAPFREPFSVAWAAPDETQPGWAYFAKKEYGANLGPVVGGAWCSPTLLGIGCASATTSQYAMPNQPGVNGASMLMSLVMNGIGPNQTVTVQVSVQGTGSSYSFPVTVSQTSTTFGVGVVPVNLDPVTFQEPIGVSATYGGRTVTANFVVTQ